MQLKEIPQLIRGKKNENIRLVEELNSGKCKKIFIMPEAWRLLIEKAYTSFPIEILRHGAWEENSIDFN